VTCGMAWPSLPAATAKSSACGLGNAVGLTLILDRRQQTILVEQPIEGSCSSLPVTGNIIDCSTSMVSCR